MTFAPEDRYLSIYRMHPKQKTAIGGDMRRRELASIYRAHAGPRYAQLYSRCCERRGAILAARRWVRRLRLRRWEGVVFKAAFPLLFCGFPGDDVGDIITVV